MVRGDETSHTYERKIQPMPKLGPWVDELERQLEANEKKQRRVRLSLLQIYEDLAALPSTSRPLQEPQLPLAHSEGMANPVARPARRMVSPGPQAKRSPEGSRVIVAGIITGPIEGLRQFSHHRADRIRCGAPSGPCPGRACGDAAQNFLRQPARNVSCGSAEPMWPG